MTDSDRQKNRYSITNSDKEAILQLRKDFEQKEFQYKQYHLQYRYHQIDHKICPLQFSLSTNINKLYYHYSNILKDKY